MTHQLLRSLPKPGPRGPWGNPFLEFFQKWQRVDWLPHFLQHQTNSKTKRWHCWFVLVMWRCCQWHELVICWHEMESSCWHCWHKKANSCWLAVSAGFSQEGKVLVFRAPSQRLQFLMTLRSKNRYCYPFKRKESEGHIFSLDRNIVKIISLSLERF